MGYLTVLVIRFRFSFFCCNFYVTRFVYILQSKVIFVTILSLKLTPFPHQLHRLYLLIIFFLTLCSLLFPLISIICRVTEKDEYVEEEDCQLEDDLGKSDGAVG